MHQALSAVSQAEQHQEVRSGTGHSARQASEAVASGTAVVLLLELQVRLSVAVRVRSYRVPQSVS